MTAPGDELGSPMQAPRSGTRLRRPWRILLAHDASAPTCDLLLESLERALGEVEIVEASSVEGGRASVATCPFDACFVCLDLPPAPLGGVRLANEALRRGLPVVLV